VLAAVTGGVTGLVVAGFDRLVVDVLLDQVLGLSPWLIGFVPLAGLALAALVLRVVARNRDPGTADAYLRAYHDPARPLALAEVPGRALAAVATLGSGGAMGLEGPSLYFGAAVGTFLQRRFPRLTRATPSRLLLVTGAAAGVGAVFKAPATGALFALEVPYTDDLARRMLFPALVSSACGYLTFAAVNDTTPLVPIRGHAPFDFADLAGALALGVAAGLCARAFAWLLRGAKRVAVTAHPVVRVLGAGLAIAALFGVSRTITSTPVTVGVGYRTIAWALGGDHAVWALLAILALRCLTTGATVAGGGVGGLFVPLVVAGALLGRATTGMVGDPHSTLFVVIGIAAVLGAGYRVPLAAVVFVAEASGRPGFVVPALLAVVAAALVMGRSSVTDYQRASADRDLPGKPGEPRRT